MTFPRDGSKAARAAGIELRLSEHGEGFETRDSVRSSVDVLSFFFVFRAVQAHVA